MKEPLLHFRLFVDEDPQRHLVRLMFRRPHLWQPVVMDPVEAMTLANRLLAAAVRMEALNHGAPPQQEIRDGTETTSDEGERRDQGDEG